LEDSPLAPASTRQAKDILCHPLDSCDNWTDCNAVEQVSAQIEEELNGEENREGQADDMNDALHDIHPPLPDYAGRDVLYNIKKDRLSPVIVVLF